MRRVLLILVAVALVAGLQAPVGATQANVGGDWVRVTGIFDMDGVDSRATRSVDGYFGAREFYVRLASPISDVAEEFAFDGSSLKAVITDPNGAKGTAEGFDSLWLANAIGWPDSMSKLLSGQVSKMSISSSVTYGGVLTIDAEPVAEPAGWTSAFGREYAAAEASGGITLSEARSDGEPMGADGERYAGVQSMTAGSTIRDGWIYSIYGLGGDRCVYEFSYRDFSTAYYYGSSTAYGDCYTVGVSLYGDSQVAWPFYGYCSWTIWFLGFSGNLPTRAYETGTWPNPNVGEGDGACSNHVGYDGDGFQIAPWDGLNAASP
ncbi:MAG: hypothetical protein GWP04_12120 [Gammaproteobacteria bacterium]|nr:hypothetical protein [Gammaproteobacteria bacterium]